MRIVYKNLGTRGIVLSEGDLSRDDERVYVMVLLLRGFNTFLDQNPFSNVPSHSRRN